jgi:hypothetical protein
MTVDNDLPDFPKLLHSIGTHLKRKTSIYQAFEEVLLIREVSNNFSWISHNDPSGTDRKDPICEFPNEGRVADREHLFVFT